MNLTIKDVRAENIENMKFSMRKVADRFFGDTRYTFSSAMVEVEGNIFVGEVTAYEAGSVPWGQPATQPVPDEEWDPFRTSHYPF